MSKRHRSDSAPHDDQPSALPTGRLDAFSDGVFGIALTLLVLNLQVPRLTAETPVSTLYAELLKQWPAYLSFVAAFVNLGTVWISHHRMTRYFAKVDHAMQVINLFLLMFVTLVPFTTNLLATYLTQPDKLLPVVLIYGIGWQLQGLCIWGLWRYSDRNGLLKPTIAPPMMRRMYRQLTVGTILGLIATLSVFINPLISLAGYFLIGIIYVLPIRGLTEI